MNAEETEKTKKVYRQWSSRWWAAPVFLLATAQAPAEPFDSLKTVPVPKPEDLSTFVRNEAALVQLGKALFWDMQVGSDGVQACASCHFAAGADPRKDNQISPGLLDQTNPDGGDPGDQTFEVLKGLGGGPTGGGGPNHTLKPENFPFTVFDPDQPPFDANNRTDFTNDVASSQGVFNTEFVDAHGGRPVDVCRNVPDPVFKKNGLNTRRVEPRNTPNFHNAVFNFRNFWDGRAQHEFNGVNPFGSRDPDACVFKATNPTQPPQCIKVEIKNCSQCSQAVGPPRSFFEMSCDGRAFAEIGQKLTTQTIALGKQLVHKQDSVLGALAKNPAKGINKSYAALIQQAFRPEWWNSSFFFNFNPGSELSNDVIPGNFAPVPPPGPPQYTHMQANFSLFFGLSVGMYMATQVADDTPADKFADAGRTGTALTARQQLGLQVFEGEGVLPPDGVTDGRCANCHGGAETTNASVRNVGNQRLERMQMGFGPPACLVADTGIDGNCIAVYDNGFYNIGARPTLDDLAVGGRDPFTNPLSETEFCQQRVGGPNPCQPEITCIDERADEGIFCPPAGVEACELAGQGNQNTERRCPLLANERIAVDGNFKTPHLRNQLLTGPYFHNGGKSTLEQVVRAYNRGLDFRDVNQNDLDPDIEANLGLTEAEITALVDFLACGLLDKRVAYDQAPFDHPEIFVPTKHTITNDGFGNAKDNLLKIPAVGAGGVCPPGSPPACANNKKLKAFLNLAPGAGVTCSY